MARRKRHWLWNILIVVTIIFCAFAFVVHYKNWTKLEPDHLRILSGIYYKELPYLEIDSVEMVAKIPQMERISGFSAGKKEKGVFKDSVNPENKVHVYVDNLMHPKIKLVHQDSLKVFLNLTDSLATQQMYISLSSKIDSIKVQFSAQN